MKLLLLLFALNAGSKEDRVLIEKSYEINNPQGFIVMIDNINGPVDVVPSDDNKVYLSLEIIIQASTDDLIEQGKRDLQLGEKISEDSLELFMKAPFVKRCDWGNWRGYSSEDHPDYRFKYRFKVRIPKEASIVAKTVNKGDVLIENIEGTVSASNVNGKVDIVNARKVRKASSVNGDITVSYVESPKESTRFNTVNGDFNLELPNDFRAKVFFDSMNGNLYTAFDYTTLSPKVEKTDRGGTFRIETKSGVEIGSGGPELSFESINGDVYLRRLN